MKFLASKLNLRLYQQAILGTAKAHNCLVVIPTGLGKTHIALGLAVVVFAVWHHYLEPGPHKWRD